MLQLKNISKAYGDKTVLSNISFVARQGEIIGLLGVNGAGKSTLMKIIATIVTQSSGEVLYDNQTVSNDNRSYRSEIGYLSEDNPLYENMYVREYIEYVAGLYRVEQPSVLLLIQKLGLQTELKKKVKELSKGNRQRVGLAQALVHNPKLLILDEATSGLDTPQRDEFYNILAENAAQRIVLFSTHLLHEVKQICTRVIIIEEGKIVADTHVENLDSIADDFNF